MSNLTINVDERLIKLARVRAIQQGTSLSAKVREFLVAYTGEPSERAEADPTAALLRMIDEVRREAREHTEPASAQPPSKRGSLRDELYAAACRAPDWTGQVSPDRRTESL